MLADHTVLDHTAAVVVHQLVVLQSAAVVHADLAQAATPVVVAVQHAEALAAEAWDWVAESLMPVQSLVQLAVHTFVVGFHAAFSSRFLTQLMLSRRLSLIHI